MNFNCKPEVLAPAGTLDAVSAVLDAGADAVYLGGKKLNMRQHRSSYNLSDDEIAEAIRIAHQRNKKIYLTLNNIVLESQLNDVRKVLRLMGDLNPDAIIVQDLGVAALAREICVNIPLHASTMMNVHSAQTAETLKMLGFTRVITSRDISLHEVRRIGEESGLEMEYFVHGDMCIAQSSQCLLSGIAFGESANCGRCTKPCRWEWQLSEEGKHDEIQSTGYLLAKKDLCLYQYIPNLVQNGVVSLKIEGRMRSAEFLAPIINGYRRAVDAYFEDPAHYTTDFEQMDELYSHRVRELTSSHAFSNLGGASVDPSGAREPRFFSRSGPKPMLTTGGKLSLSKKPKSDIELVVRVADLECAESAIQAGADALYFGGDRFMHGSSSYTASEFAEFVKDGDAQNIRLAVLSPRIGDERELEEWRWYLRKLSKLRPLKLGVSNLGALQVAREMKFKEIIADFSFNVSNSVEVDELSTLGVQRVTASVELECQDLMEFAGTSRLPIEVIGHGPLPGMLLEHCVVAAASGESGQNVCSMTCHNKEFTMWDKSGQSYRLMCDRRCRNHLFTANDVCVLPNLVHILTGAVSALRIEAQFEDAETTACIVSVYRKAIDTLSNLEPFDFTDSLQQLESVAKRPFSDGAFAFDRL